VITTAPCSKNIALAARSHLERVTGIEPALSAWEAGDAPWSGTPVIGCDQEIQPLQLHLAAVWVENWVENRRCLKSVETGAAWSRSMHSNTRPPMSASTYTRTCAARRLIRRRAVTAHSSEPTAPRQDPDRSRRQLPQGMLRHQARPRWPQWRCRRPPASRNAPGG
jgi:hypothetical protein